MTPLRRLAMLAAALAQAGCIVVPVIEYGHEVADVAVYPDQPFELRYMPRHGGNHRLWIDHTVEFEGWDFEIEGPLSVEIGDRVVREVDVVLNACDGPVDPLVRIDAGTYALSQVGNRVWLSSTVFAIDVPGREVAREVVLRGEWSADPNTEVEALWLVVTD